MKKLIVQSLVILGINAVVGFLAGLAFTLLVFKSDPMLAAIPAIFALPGIILQPWFVLFFFLPFGPVFAGLPTTVVTVVLYRFLDRKGKLEQAKFVLARLRRRRALLLFSALIALGVAAGIARHLDFPALRRGVPGTLEHSVRDLALVNPIYYCLGSFIDSEWLWQASLSESDLNRLAGELRMHPIDACHIGEDFRQDAWTVTMRAAVFMACLSHQSA